MRLVKNPITGMEKTHQNTQPIKILDNFMLEKGDKQNIAKCKILTLLPFFSV